MKRALLLVAAVTLAFGACQKKDAANEEMAPAVEQTPAAAPAPAPADTTAAPATATPAAPESTTAGQ